MENITCTSRIITFDRNGLASENCQTATYDLLLKWEKPESNRNVSYIMRWGKKNVRETSVNESRVLKGFEIGTKETVSRFKLRLRCHYIKIF